MEWRVALAVTTTVLLAAMESVEAQDALTVEMGGLARYGGVGEGLELENAGGIGGRLGVFFLRDLSAEVELAYAEPDLSAAVVDPEAEPGERSWASHQLFSARLLYGLPLGERKRVLLGGGYTYDNFRRAPPGATADGHGIGAVAGVRYGLTERLSLRAEGTAGYVVSPQGDLDANPFNVGVQAGMSVFFFDRERVQEVELPAPPPDTVLVERERPRGEPTTLCLATGEEVRVEITAQGDTLVGPEGTRVQDLRPGVVFAGAYAEGREWFEDEEALELAEHEGEPLQYRRTDEEVKLNCGEIARVGQHESVPVFAEADEESPHRRLYLPTRPGLWQGYELEPADSG